MKIYNKLVPFTSEDRLHWQTKEIEEAAGSQVGYVRYLPKDMTPLTEDGIEWRVNKPFTANMQVVNYEKGRSSVNFIVKDEKNRHYYISLKTMFNLLSEMDKGHITITEWIVAKQGTAFSIKPYRGE